MENAENNVAGLGVDTNTAPAEDTSCVELAAQVSALTAERDQWLAEKTELNERLLRRQAEFENFRRRADRERADFAQFAGMEIVRELLPVLDDFERAMKAECADANYSKGVELIYQRLFELLKKQGLEPIEAKGKTFDPHLHQAVQREPTDEAEDQTVLDEYQRGYNYKGKLLRPSMVRVAVRP